MSGNGTTHNSHNYNQNTNRFSKHAHYDLAIVDHDVEISIRLKIAIKFPVYTIVAFLLHFDNAMT